jgi:misacylated tRNA(Ala) deacylase
MTEKLYRDDPEAVTCTATVTASGPAGFETDRTVFYAMSGGQAGDTGRVLCGDGRALAVTDTVHPGRDRDRILHCLAEGDVPPAPGETVRLELDAQRRRRLMRMHTALHLLSVVMPFGVTGGAIAPDKGRLDFDMPDPPEDIASVETALNALVARDLPVTAEWITEAELDARPDMVKTMAVAPPRGEGRVRLVRIGPPGDTVDLQPCGGTHVSTTGAIGALRIGKVEKKGRSNRRVNLHFAD